MPFEGSYDYHKFPYYYTKFILYSYPVYGKKYGVMYNFSMAYTKIKINYTLFNSSGNGFHHLGTQIFNLSHDFKEETVFNKPKGLRKNFT